MCPSGNRITSFQGSYGEATPKYRRSLAIREKVLGPDHPNVAISLNNLAGLLDIQVRVGPWEVSDAPLLMVWNV